MNRQRIISDIISVILMAFSGTQLADGECQRYSAQYFLATCDGGTQANGLNSQGDVAGAIGCALSGIDYACAWVGGDLELITTPAPYASSNASDISDVGTVVGWSWPDAGNHHAFVYQGGVYTELPLLAGHWKGEAGAVSSGASQWIAGYSQGGSFLRAVLWQDGAIFEIPTPQGLSSVASDVNASGDACGYIGSPAVDALGFVWESGGMTILPMPHGAVAVVLNSINESRHACGTYRYPLGGSLQLRYPFFWNGRAIVELGLLPGWSRGYAHGINNADSVVGYCESPPLSAGFVWHDGVMSKLNDLLEPGANVDVRYAWAINDSGQIACDGRIPNGSSFISVAVLLTPVAPIPGDLTCDWIVGGDDLAILLGAWGACDSCAADVDGNGTVDAADIAVLLGDWGDWNG